MNKQPVGRGILSASLALGLWLVAAENSQAQARTRHLYKGHISQSVAQADRLLLTGKYAAATTYYKNALARNSRDLNARIGLGMALGKQFKLDAAMEQFNKVLSSDPGSPGAHAGKAMVMLNSLQSSSGTVRKNRDVTLQEAEQEARRAIDSDSQLPEAHYTLGMVLKEQGKFQDAAAEFRSATIMDPRYADGFTGLGLTALAQNKNGEAMSNFKTAIRLNSGDWTAHYGMGQALLSQGQTDAAIKELNIASYQFPNSWPVRLALGRAYETQGNTVAAVREYQESIRIKPENAAAYLGIANVREARSDFELSISELRSGLELLPNNADMRLRIGDQSLRIEKIDDAIKEYETVLSLAPGNSRAAEGLTTAYYLKSQKETTGGYFGDNDYEHAEQMIARAIQINPDDMRLRLAQAKLRALSGETVDMSSIQTPRTDGERISYAQLALAQNRFDEATAQMNTVIAHANTSKQTFAIADLALMIHDLDSADAAYRKASVMPGGAERGRRGLAQVAKMREGARKNLTFASDLDRKRMSGSAIDAYHDAVFANPRVPQSRLGLARVLEREAHSQAPRLREAATQYRAYVALSPAMPAKEQDKYVRAAEKLDAKAYKIERRPVAQR